MTEKDFRKLHSGWPFILVACVLAVSACGSTKSMSDSNGSPTDTSDLEALYWARQDSARSLYTEADVRFMTGMISHHAQALIMADLAPSNDAGREVQTLALRIINAQRDEIATMQKWLRDRGEPVPEVHIMGTTLMIHGAEEHDMHMPGMLSPEQLAELMEARGPEFDRVFLTYMIQHHSGAVTMVDELFSKGGAVGDGAAFKLASDVNVDQRTEIDRMRRMLDTLSVSNRNP